MYIQFYPGSTTPQLTSYGRQDIAGISLAYLAESAEANDGHYMGFISEDVWRNGYNKIRTSLDMIQGDEVALNNLLHKYVHTCI